MNNTLTDLAYEAVEKLALRLLVLQKDWGPKDFPDDNGRSFRNRLYVFSDSIAMILRVESTEADPYDPWVFTNQSALAALEAETLLRLYGILCFHAQSWQWYFWLANAFPEPSDAHIEHIQRCCNWLYAAHALPSDVAQAWYQVTIESIGDSLPAFGARSEAAINTYMKMLVPLPKPPHSFSWAGFAIKAFVESQAQGDDWVTQYANKYFSQLE